MTENLKIVFAPARVRPLLTIFCVLFAALATCARAQWRVVSVHDSRQSLPEQFANQGSPIKVGDELPENHRFRWLVAKLEIPETIEGEATRGRTVGLQVNGGDGGEVWIDRKLHGRYDNDHPLLAVLRDNASPGETVDVAVQVYANVQGGSKFDEARLVLVPQDRTEPVKLSVSAQTTRGEVPDGLIGLSQGGGVSDYEDATAEKLRDGGFKWFRTDNVFTSAIQKNDDDQLAYDWTAFDQRVDFIHKVGAEPILAVSYMPIPLDAVPDNNRQSAPNDYGKWEELCYEAAKRCLERGKRVPYWEVWNEANSGWIKPGPNDAGSDEFKQLYRDAIGHDEPDHEIVRRFEAYAKLYRATARGVRRADPEAQVGGPALASGPFERDDCGHCHHGQGFARGLMLWCQKEKLPLNFVSWHEYFHPAEVLVTQVEGFRRYLQDFPELEKSVRSFMITEWNEAWWPNRPQDHEIGAAWCADGMVRAMIPHKIDRPCLFYVKQGDMNFRGDWAILMEGNRPKPTYNMARIFNSLGGEWLETSGGDDDVCAVAALDAENGRLAIVLVNYRFRYPVERDVNLSIAELPNEFVGGQWKAWTIDPRHSNIFTDKERCELEMTDSGTVSDAFAFETRLLPNSVVLLELDAKR